MKSIKSFKYKDSCEYEYMLDSYDYKPADVKGFSFAGKEQYHGNVLKEYYIHFNDGEKEYFTVADFKSFNEINQSRLGFNGNKLLEWYEDANVRRYRVSEKTYVKVK